MLIPVFSLSNGKVVFNGSSLPIEPFALAEKYSMLGVFVIDPQVRDNEEDKKLIVQIIKQLGSCRVVVHDHATALFYLNLGATKVVIDPSTPQDSLAEMFSSLPKERLIVSLDGASGAEDRINALKEIASEFLVPFQGDLSSHLDLIKKLVSVVGKQGHIIVSGASTPEIIAQLDKTNVAVQSDLGDDKLSVEASLIAHLVTDRPDGLYTTVVVDEQGVSLGLVYSSKESISEAIRLKRGVYYSRSRKSIWYKGDTSGDTQKLLRIEVDCDGDALKFVVGQGGDGFCHLKTRSCFSDVDAGLGALMRTLESRKTSAPEGSYTKRLFEDSDLLRAKLVEEANELADAQTKDEVTGETADVIFFALVAAAKAGVTLADVERELDRRSLKVQRRPGDSKPHIVSLLQEQDRLKGLKKAEKTLTQ